MKLPMARYILAGRKIVSDFDIIAVEGLGSQYIPIVKFAHQADVCVYSKQMICISKDLKLATTIKNLKTDNWKQSCKTWDSARGIINNSTWWPFATGEIMPFVVYHVGWFCRGFLRTYSSVFFGPLDSCTSVQSFLIPHICIAHVYKVFMSLLHI